MALEGVPSGFSSSATSRRVPATYSSRCSLTSGRYAASATNRRACARSPDEHAVSRARTRARSSSGSTTASKPRSQP
jgi:hypothetical protein